MKSYNFSKYNKNPFSKEDKCEFPICRKRMESLMKGIQLCSHHYGRIRYRRKCQRKDISTEEIKQLIEQIKVEENSFQANLR